MRAICEQRVALYQTRKPVTKITNELGIARTTVYVALNIYRETRDFSKHYKGEGERAGSF